MLIQTNWYLNIDDLNTKYCSFGILDIQKDSIKLSLHDVKFNSNIPMTIRKVFGKDDNEHLIVSIKSYLGETDGFVTFLVSEVFIASKDLTGSINSRDTFSGITSLDFSMNNLQKWINRPTLQHNFEKNQDGLPVFCKEIHLKINADIDVFENDSKKIYIFEKPFRSCFSNFEEYIGAETYLKVEFKSSTNYEKSFNEILKLIRFFALITGEYEGTNLINFLTEKGDVIKCYINFSKHFSLYDNIFCERVIEYKDCNCIPKIFEKWEQLCDSYGLLVNSVFDLFVNTNLHDNDRFIRLIAFLEGYVSRKKRTESETVQLREYLEINLNSHININKLKDIISKCTINELKNQNIDCSITTNGDINISMSRKEVIRWICSGYLMKDSLSKKLKFVDDMLLNPISQNLSEKFADRINTHPEKSIYGVFQDVRNYMAHYGSDSVKDLDIEEYHQANKVLICLVIALLLFELFDEKKVCTTYFDINNITYKNI